jgi:hypothetical protein
VLSPEIENRDEVQVGNCAKHKKTFYSKWYTGCLKIREFRIQSVVGKNPVELEKYLEKKSLFLKKR